MWCVTRKDLETLEAQVLEALLNGDIPNSDDPRYHNPDHDDPQFGPSVHAVMTHFIKPQIPKGSSWALERNPAGKDCEVFATHGWDEGFF